MTSTTPATDAGLIAQVNEFLAHEADLLDTRQWDEWLDLFDPNGHYWVPTSAQQTEPNACPSLAYEDHLLLKIRVERLRHPQAHSQHPPSTSQHVLQAARIVSNQAELILTRQPFSYVEHRGGQQTWLTGVARHRLIRQGQNLRIQLKRIDLLGADQALPMIQLFL
ncbi:MAG: aromatic-ring-hydroxylating dioxygenase subunit beta [Burkholderiaceae bacterium]